MKTAIGLVLAMLLGNAYAEVSDAQLKLMDLSQLSDIDVSTLGKKQQRLHKKLVKKRAKFEASFPNTKVGKHGVMKTVTFFFDSPLPLKKVKICAITNLSIPSVIATDESGSFIGPATGTYYGLGNTEVVQGSDGIIKYVDEEENVVIVRGREDYTNMMSAHAIDFTITLQTTGSGYSQTFSNIKNLQKSTGYMKNSGFKPVLTRWGAGGEAAFNKMREVSEDLHDCITI